MKYILLTLSMFCFVISLSAQEEEQQLIKSIFFGGGSYYIDGVQIQELYDWLDGIEGIENYEISIHSHTDDIGSISYNQWLSRMRSEATFQVILDKNIVPQERITIEDFGEQNPIYDNSKFEGKLMNRRVDVILKPIFM